MSRKTKRKQQKGLSNIGNWLKKVEPIEQIKESLTPQNEPSLDSLTISKTDKNAKDTVMALKEWEAVYKSKEYGHVDE